MKARQEGSKKARKRSGRRKAAQQLNGRGGAIVTREARTLVDLLDQLVGGGRGGVVRSEKTGLLSRGVSQPGQHSDSRGKIERSRQVKER